MQSRRKYLSAVGLSEKQQFKLAINIGRKKNIEAFKKRITNSSGKFDLKELAEFLLEFDNIEMRKGALPS